MRRSPMTSTGPAPVPRSRSPSRTASAAIALRRPAASSGSSPSASWAASAEECVHPEPCDAPPGDAGRRSSQRARRRRRGRSPVCRPRRGRRYHDDFRRRETGRRGRAPRPSAGRCALPLGPLSTRASCRLGVTTVARGNSVRQAHRGPPDRAAFAPLSATITGSSTTGTPGRRSSALATASIVSTFPSMPILTASTPISVATART